MEAVKDAVAVTGSLLALSWLVLGLRLFVRGIVLRNFFWDDHFAVLAMVCCVNRALSYVKRLTRHR